MRPYSPIIGLPELSLVFLFAKIITGHFVTDACDALEKVSTKYC